MTELDLVRADLMTLKRRLHLHNLAILVLLIVAVTAAMKPRDRVIRARGVVITDSQGRDRIVIGAPMGNALADPKLDQSVGVAVLDSVGHLHVAMGTNPPLILDAGQAGTRIAGVAGFTIYDPRDGRERGGFGAFSDGRANLCLDYAAKAKEAACMSVAPGDQYAAVMLNGTPTEPQFDRVGLFVGADGGGSIKAFGGGANNGGVMVRVGKGVPTVTVYDSTGNALKDLATRPQSV